MGGFPPPPGSNPPSAPYSGDPPQDGFPPPGGVPVSPGVGAPAAGPFGPAGSYVAPPGYGYPGAWVKAGFWARFAAALIDSIIVGLFSLPAQIAIRAGSTKVESCSLDSSGNIDPTGTVNNGLCEVPTGTTWAIFGVLSLVAFIAGVVYYAKLEGGSGQTPGKMALGIKVVDARTGG